MAETTTIQISKKTKKKLDSLKLGEKESYEEVLERIFKVLKKISKNVSKTI